MMSADVNQSTSQGSRNGGTAIERVLSKLQNLTQTGTGWMALCPAHDDHQPSLSVDVGEKGRVLVRCHAGCETEAVVEALGLTMRDLFEKHSETEGGGGPIPPDPAATVQPDPQGGLTLARYAEAKRLPPDSLVGLGLSEVRSSAPPYLRIPYMNPEGEEVAVRFRLALAGGHRFRWAKGAKPCLYGLQRLNEAGKAGFVVVVEGESDCHTLWYHGIPAVGLPGAASWKEEWASHFEGIGRIYVIMEPDKGREAMAKWLASSAIRDRVRLVHLDGAKDPSDLYLQNPDAFALRFQAALDASVPWEQRERAEADERAREVWALCEPLAKQPRILDCFAEAIAAAGVAGESRVVKLLYLGFATRLLDRPVSMVIKGPSSAGKSFLVQRVLDFLPKSAYYSLTAMSERALAYSEEPLSHRFLVLYEAAGLGKDFAAYLVRSLLSEGRVRYETVDKVSGKLQARLIDREGPTGLALTTTQVQLDHEFETRLLSLPVTDTPEQTRLVMRALARRHTSAADYTPWHALQEWLATGEREVDVPYGEELSEQIPPLAVRLRRDFGALLDLIRAHALLHRGTRERDAEGRVVADLDDYAVVRELVSDVLAYGAEATVPDIVRQTVYAVERLTDRAAAERLLQYSSGTPFPAPKRPKPGAATGQGQEGITVRQVADELELDRSTAYRRAERALSLGYLKNLEDRPHRPWRLALEDPLPKDTEMLPSPERLFGCAVARNSREDTPPSPHGRPYTVATPRQPLTWQRT